MSNIHLLNVTVLLSDPKLLPIGAGAYSDRSVEDPAEIQHILITQMKADFFNGQQGGAEQLTGQVHLLPGVIGLYGHSGRFFKTGSHMLVA